MANPDEKPIIHWGKEIAGGTSAAAVVLPQAMAFGVALWAPAGLGASQGAMAGLVTAAAFCLGSGLLGGTLGLISSPTGPTLVLLAGALASLMGAGMGGGQLLFTLSLVLLLSGVFQVGIGLIGGGKLIKYIPYPVVAGFMTGSAILMLKSQVGPLDFRSVPDAFSNWRLVPLLIAALTFALITFMPRFLPRLPGTLAGLLGGTLIFHALSLLASTPLPSDWLIGSLPRLGLPDFELSSIPWATLPWTVIVGSAAALALMASLDTLLTAVIADVTTRGRHDARREMVGQGIGQLLSGLFGGMAAAGTTGATMVAVKSGGRRFAGLVAGLTLLLLGLVGGKVGMLLPISVLAGIILHVAVFMIDTDIVAWVRRRKTRLDGIIAILVTSVTVGYDLMVAVGVGVCIAIALFLRNLVQAEVVHRRSNAVQRPSLRARPQEQREALQKSGDRIVLYELRGNLFFGTADKLFDELAQDLQRAAWVILHCRRVNQVDLTGAKILAQIADRLAKNGGELIFCEVHRGMGLGHKVRKTFRKISPQQTTPSVRTFVGSDQAIEYAEDALLAELGFEEVGAPTIVDLVDNDLCKELLPTEIDAFEKVIQWRDVQKGDVLFEAGQVGSDLILVHSGELEIRLPTTKHHHKRLAIYGPGTVVGELAFLSPGPRAASAVVKRDGRLALFDRDGFDRLNRIHPEAAQGLLMALAQKQVGQLRWSAEEIRRLAQW